MAWSRGRGWNGIGDAVGVVVAGVAEDGKEHDRSLTAQLPQAGRDSSHLICRRLHSQQPLRDLRWARRSLAATVPSWEPEPELGRLLSEAVYRFIAKGNDPGWQASVVVVVLIRSNRRSWFWLVLSISKQLESVELELLCDVGCDTTLESGGGSRTARREGKQQKKKRERTLSDRKTRRLVRFRGSGVSYDGATPW